jgi:mRNA interferase MazF
VVDLTRGDVVVVALPGEYGKRRNAVVIQADPFIADFPSVLVCPITSSPLAHSVARVPVAATPENGLSMDMALMVDKIAAMPAIRIVRTLGRVDESVLARLNISLATLLGI